MIDLERQKDTEGTVLQIAGEMTLEHAAELKQALLELMAEAGALRIDCAKVERVDLAGLQSLCAVTRAAAEQNRSLSIAVNGLAVFQQAFTATGFPTDWQQLLTADQSQEAS